MEYANEEEYIQAVQAKFADQIAKSNAKIRETLMKRGYSESEIQRCIQEGEQESIEKIRQFYDEHKGDFWKNG